MGCQEGTTAYKLMGFAIRRTDFNPLTGETLRVDWLNGQKRFKETEGNFGNSLSLGSYEVVLGILDIISPNEAGDANKALTAVLNGKEICLYESDTLPYADLMKCADEMYKISPILRPNGICVSSQDRIGNHGDF